MVEDDEIVCRLLVHLLSDHHEIETASDGQEVLEKFSAGRYDAALIDLGMPEMSGDYVAKEIKRRDPSVATVLITGWEILDDDPRISPFDFKVQKPFDSIEAFRDTVAQAVGLHDVRAKEGG